jgi:hypothetical protein
MATPSWHVVGSTKYDGLTDEISLVRCHPEEGVVVAATATGKVWIWSGLQDEVSPVIARRVHDGSTGVEPDHLEMLVTRRQDDEGVHKTVQILLHAKLLAEIVRIDCPLGGDVKSPIHTVIFSTGRAVGITAIHVDFTMPRSISLPTSLVPADFAARVAVPSGLTTPDDQTPSPSTPGSASARHDESLSRAQGLGHGRFIVAGTEDGWMYIWNWAGKEVEEDKGKEKKVVKSIVGWEAGEGALTTVTAARGLVASGR